MLDRQPKLSSLAGGLGLFLLGMAMMTDGLKLAAGSALWVLFGANVGTTVTALFAAIGATPNARRAAAAHVVFNVITGVVALALFHTIFNVVGVLQVPSLAVDALTREVARIGHVAARQ